MLKGKSEDKEIHTRFILKKNINYIMLQVRNNKSRLRFHNGFGSKESSNYILKDRPNKLTDKKLLSNILKNHLILRDFS